MAKRTYTIWLDMDGVIVDFESGFKQLAFKYFGKPYSTTDVARMYGPDKVEEIKKTTNISFWSNLNPLPNYKLLIDFIFNNFDDVKILSSAGKSGVNGQMGKKIWLSKHNIPLTASDIIITNHSSQKKKYADENQILIDDFDRNIMEWSQSGGIAIHHKNIPDTIKQLKRYADFQTTNL